ncbi:unnamed protein product [Haemonchus placei]|uniref:Rod_C domain-containing protein n=1 Tax=Haemonchus placei TaxID=6290 RepID=A0A158QLW6_HAEPC|nr:unnamed protein product [Haemonchus placei]
MLADACVHGCEFVLWRLQEVVGNVDSPADTEIVEQDTFIKTLWAKRLGKACLSPTLPRKPIEIAIEEFARHKVDPNIVTEYVDEFYGLNEIPDKLLNYAITLVQLASNSEDQREIINFLEVAHQALKVNEVPIHAEKLFSAFRDLLYTISPYSYSTIQFIVSHLQSTCDDENRSFVSGCTSILNFVMERRRASTICKEELMWYTNREKQMATDRKDSNIENFAAYCRCFFEQGSQSSSFNAHASSFNEDGDKSNLYERDVLVVAMPELAKQRLPFHPFLYLASGDIERFLVPIVEKELDIYNVLCWQSVLRSVFWLKGCASFSRSRLLSIAVGKISADVIAKGQDLASGEVATIEQLLMQTTSRNAVVSCVAMCLKKLPLCETKIRLMEIGRNIAQHWLMDPASEPAMDDTERISIEEQVNRLGVAIEKYNTELILKKSGLYNERTCDLTESPEELIGFIYSDLIDWKCEKEREQKMAVIVQLAKANHMNNLETIQEQLVMNWLIADKIDDAYAVDPNDTMGNTAVDLGMSTADENEIFLLPFFDVAVDRIVYVLKLINMEKIMLDLITYLRRDPSTVTGGFRTIVRAACVLLRAYTDEQLKRANYDQLKICVDLDAILYGRLLELAHVDIPLDTFRRQDKSVVVRSLVAPGVRWTSQLTFLVASLIVDNDIADRSVIEVVLNRLQAAQKREIQEKKLHKVKNLAMLWARAADWYLGSIEHVNEGLRDEFERWFYFAISCPVEGGRAFDSIRNALRARNYTLAAHLISVVATFAQVRRILADNSDSNKYPTLLKALASDNAQPSTSKKVSDTAQGSSMGGIDGKYPTLLRALTSGTSQPTTSEGASGSKPAFQRHRVHRRHFHVKLTGKLFTGIIEASKRGVNPVLKYPIPGGEFCYAFELVRTTKQGIMSCQAIASEPQLADAKPSQLWKSIAQFIDDNAPEDERERKEMLKYFYRGGYKSRRRTIARAAAKLHRVSEEKETEAQEDEKQEMWISKIKDEPP